MLHCFPVPPARSTKGKMHSRLLRGSLDVRQVLRRLLLRLAVLLGSFDGLHLLGDLDANLARSNQGSRWAGLATSTNPKPRERGCGLLSSEAGFLPRYRLNVDRITLADLISIERLVKMDASASSSMS